MSILGVCFWWGNYDEYGLPHGDSSMTFYSSETGQVTGTFKQVTIHGMTAEDSMRVPLAPQGDEALHLDGTASVAHLVDDDWLFEQDASNSGWGLRTTTKVANVKVSPSLQNGRCVGHACYSTVSNVSRMVQVARPCTQLASLLAQTFRSFVLLAVPSASAAPHSVRVVKLRREFISEQ